jgi:small-conductance mechanosensitive channel
VFVNVHRVCSSKNRPGARIAQSRDVNVSGVRLLGVTAANGHRLLVTVIVVLAVVGLRYLVVWTVRLATGGKPNERVVFWTSQGAGLVTAAAVLLSLISIWFEDAGRFATAGGLIGAGLAFALQKVVTAFAGYLVILRGRTFTVGDRITMGGVRGDVISLGFLQTRIMEMGETPAMQGDPAASWVFARQYTGRIVSVTNDKVFDTPVYNYTREFPYMWEEMRIPIAYGADRGRAEEILLGAAHEVVDPIERISEPLRHEMEQKYFVDIGALHPQVYYRLTDNWVELTLRFVSHPKGARNLKDQLSRMILDRLEAAKIGIASATYDVVGFPPIRFEGKVAEKLVSAIEKANTAA